MLKNQKAGFNLPVKLRKFLQNTIEHGENAMQEVIPIRGVKGGSILEHEVLTKDEEDDDGVDKETYINDDMMVELPPV